LLPGVLAGVLGVDVIDSNGAIAHQEVNNRSPIKYGAAVTVRYRVTDLGDASLSMASKMAADDVLAAEGTVVHVVLDESDAPAAVPELWVRTDTRLRERRQQQLSQPRSVLNSRYG